MNRRIAENKKFKALYVISISLLIVCIIAIFGTIGAASMDNSMSGGSLVVRCLLFSVAGLLSWAAARGFKHRIWRLLNEELNHITRDISHHLRYDGVPDENL